MTEAPTRNKPKTKGFSDKAPDRQKKRRARRKARARRKYGGGADQPKARRPVLSPRLGMDAPMLSSIVSHTFVIGTLSTLMWRPLFTA